MFNKNYFIKDTLFEMENEMRIENQFILNALFEHKEYVYFNKIFTYIFMVKINRLKIFIKF